MKQAEIHRQAIAVDCWIARLLVGLMYSPCKYFIRQMMIPLYLTLAPMIFSGLIAQLCVLRSATDPFIMYMQLI